MRRLSFLMGCALVAFSSTAGAAWHRVSTPHFVIYADGQPDRLRTFATRLERFDRAVRQVRGMADPKLGDGNRLTVFVVDDARAVQGLAGEMTGLTKNLAGFYRPSVDGSIAVVPERSGNSDKGALDDQATFFHEYAHHLMFSDVATPAPLWYAEGFAEFMSTATFERDGTVVLGRAAAGRAEGVTDTRTFPLELMLGDKEGKLSEPEWDRLYARGWLLTHFLTFDASRKGQLRDYLRLIAAGSTPGQASRVFGNLDELDRNLRTYAGRGRISAFKVAPGPLDASLIKVEPLSPGMASVMPAWMRLRAGVSEAVRTGLVAQFRSVAAANPGDAAVQARLAEAELSLRDYAAAEKAADRALALDPRSIDAMISKGRAIMKRAADHEAGKSFADARKWFQKANALDTEDPEPLYLFYEASIRQAGKPSANAVAALHYASNLAPQDPGVRLQSAYQHLRDGKGKEAREALAAVAFDPHNRSSSAGARAAIAAIDRGDLKQALSEMEKN